MAALRTAAALLGGLLGALGEPFSTHQRACVSGQICSVNDVVGTGLSDGDRLLLASANCGAGPVVDGMPGALGETLPALGGGTSMTWPSHITPDGGAYKLCWCSVAFVCNGFGKFAMEVGTLTVTGPVSGVAAICTSGHECLIDGIQGTLLRNGDSVMILNQCGGSPIDGFPNGAKTSTGALGGTRHGWGSEPIRALGGNYALCWCAQGATCIDGRHHRKRLGDLAVRGPAGGFTKVCATLAACTWGGLAGQGLQDGDRITILEDCGVGPPVAGFPSNAVATASGGGTEYAFNDAGGNVISAGGAVYAMCWCSTRGGGQCSSPTDFVTLAGTLTVQGPRRDHRISCIRGFPCQVVDFRGVGLAASDRLQVKLTCTDSTTSPAGFSGGGVVAPADAAGETYAPWSAVTAAFGTYRLCWCGLGWSCTANGFRMDAGELRVVGVDSGQVRDCHVLAGCSVSGITGSGLRTGDLLAVRTACGASGGAVPGWPGAGRSEPATLAGTHYSWGLAARVEADPGTYKMCWCPIDHYSGCTDPSHFVVEAGDLRLRGPVRLSKNASCVAHQSPSCVVGPFQSGFGLSPGSDRVSLLSPGRTCGVDAPDPRVGGAATGQAVRSNGLAYWPPEALPYGGAWKMCYCANYDSPLDLDSTPCSSTQDFAGEAGLLFVRGALMEQGVNCTRNEVCTFSILGYELNRDTNMIALRDSSTSCGSAASLDSVTLPGNPYPAALRIDDDQLIFEVNPIQTLETFYMCYCVPVAGGGFCNPSRLTDFVQEIGFFDIRGAIADQRWECGTGGQCRIVVRGRHLSTSDRVKIVEANKTCSARAEDYGFFRPLAPAEPAPDTTDSFATFSLGRVIVTGLFKVCYCAALGGCDAMDEYNHEAGLLHILDPLISLRLEGTTAASIVVGVNSSVFGLDSRVRCATSIYEPRSIPTAYDISDGLALVGLGKGEAADATRVGINMVEIFLNTFLRSSQMYRVWCIETAAQSFVLPSHASGILVMSPGEVQLPRARTYPGFLWQQANFFIEVFQVYDEALDNSRSTTKVRVGSAPNEGMCNYLSYDLATPMQVAHPGQPGSGRVVLLADTTLQASRWQRYVCFFGGPNATGIAMVSDSLQVQATAPGFSQRRVNGEVMQNVYRGVLMQVLFTNPAPSDGLLHWASLEQHAISGCTGASRTRPDAQIVYGANTSYFRFGDPVGRYVMCYLGNRAESTTPAPFNGIGDFEVVDVIKAIRQQPRLPSTRSTVRLQLEIRLPGVATCLVSASPANVEPGDFDGGGAFEGRATLAVAPPPAGVDPEFPRRFDLGIPLVNYQQSAGPLHIWCRHSEAEGLVFPESRDGVSIVLQAEEATASPLPPYLWHGARFVLRLSGSPYISTKRVAMHEPALPSGWRHEFVTQAGLRKLKYISDSATSEEHPVYTMWRQGQGPGPCEDSNTTYAVAVSADQYTRTETWFEGQATRPFVCYWPLPSAYPHLLAKLPIAAQPPEYLLEVEGQLRSFVYRGVSVNIRLRHGSPAGGRLLVVRKYVFNNFGYACQEFPEARYRRLLAARGVGSQHRLATRRLQAAPVPCARSGRSTSDLRLAAVESLFPEDVWGLQLPLGLNCSRDFKIYHHPSIANVSILADVDAGTYILVTSNTSALLQLLPNVGILSPNGGVPSGDEAIVQQGFTALSNYSGLHWAFTTGDCKMQELLGPYSPMYEEGAEDLPLSLYLQAALPLDGFDFAALAFLPNADTVARRTAVCGVLQPRAPEPKRAETVFDIALAGYGRTVVNNAVQVPSKVNGTGTFLHTDPLQEYVLCYLGNQPGSSGTRRLNHLSQRHTVLDGPLFNPVGEPFFSRDVVSMREELGSDRSDSVRGLVNVASELPGLVRCVALLRNLNPPTDPDDIFQPDLNSEDYVGSSDLVQYDAPDSRKVLSVNLDQTRVHLLASRDAYPGAPPIMYVWCAHRSSTVLYPPDPGGFTLRLQARPPPAFEYRQLNRTVAVLHLTLQLQFSPVSVHWADPLFPLNAHDEVRFLTRPAMPRGLRVNQQTGEMTGVPSELVHGEVRSIVASSLWPPYKQSSVDVELHVDDVLGLRFTHVNAERATLTLVPRFTQVFQPQQVFLLTRRKIQRFTRQPDEYFCSDALQSTPFSNRSGLTCSTSEGACCCAGFLLPHLPAQDVRVSKDECSLTAGNAFHTMGMVQGLLTAAEDSTVPARLASIYTAEFTLPEEVPPEEKFPVLFDIVLNVPWEEYRARQDSFSADLVREISIAIDIPEDLVSISWAGEKDGDVGFEISFYVEPRCLEEISAEVQMISFGIDTREGCSFVSPTEYMDELKAQLSNRNSAIFYRDDLTLLHKVSVERSFAFSRVMHFCNQDPFWEYAAVVDTPAECPLDTVKLGVTVLAGGTAVLLLGVACLSYLAHECAVCSLIANMHALDLLTPIMGIYTVVGDYTWLLMLRSNSVHSLHDVLFTACLAHLAACFVINFLAVRVTVVTHIQDTPWWRRNRRHLRLVLLFSCLSPRFLRVTRCSLLGLDSTTIHFGTPSKMAIVFSNLGLICLIQDIPQLLIQLYVWLIWRNAGPKVALFCIALGAQSIATAGLHHVFSRSQRSAYERVVKLLGVRRLTAGFFDISTGGQAGLAQLENMRRADGKSGGALARQEGDEAEGLPSGEFLDPSKLDPIQAALFVSKMYEKEVAAHQEEGKEESDSSEEYAEEVEEISGGGEDDDFREDDERFSPVTSSSPR